MADLSNLSNDDLAEHVRDGIQEVEDRISAAGLPRSLKRWRAGHAILHSVGLDLVDSDNVSANSVGGDKD